jgi:hypothetical protein
LQVKLSALPEGYVMAYTRRVFGFNLRQSRNGLLIGIVQAGSRRIGLASKVSIWPPRLPDMSWRFSINFAN